MREEDFYQQVPGYWERVVDNLSRWFGVHLTTLDVLILLPVIPMLPLVITWWLPWERWRGWAKVPKTVAGPYLLYCAFAAWHFQVHWWVVLIIALWGATVCAMALKQVADRKSAWTRS
jgi:hypothetical protein